VSRALMLAIAAGCALPEQGPMVRVLEALPSGSAVETGAIVSLRFTGAVSPEGLVDGRRVLLAREGDLPEALAAAESEQGADAATPRVAAGIALEEGSTRLVLHPSAPLAAGESWALVLSSRARSGDGRAVLDADGRLRPTVVRFSTAAPPPPDVLLTEVLADASTPEAGGEYVEVTNLGPGPLDLSGWRLEKRSATGTWSGCTIGPGTAGPAAEGAAALIVGGSWDGRYPLPPAVALFPCGATALAGGIANDRPPVLRLLDRGGALAAALDATAMEPCAGALEAALAPAEAGGCCTCTDGSPGVAPWPP
jgi:hypothetical protein